MHWFLASLLLVGSLAHSLPAAQSPIRYAQNFEIEDFTTHQLVTVRNTFRNSEQVYRYALVPPDQHPPELADNIQVVHTPVARVVAMETVDIGYLDALGQLDVLVGVATADYISNPQVRQALNDGQIQAIQSGQALDVERLLQLQPDLILTSTIGDPAFDLPARLARTGLPALVSASYMEQHPLARAEWIKFVAAFIGQGERADEVFEQVEARYLELIQLTEGVETRPTVLCGAPYSGVWHVPGGQSYTAQHIKDAGGDYLWRENPQQGGVPLDIERVFLRAARADFWINPSGYRSMQALLSADGRFARFQPARAGTVYNSTRQVSPGGGNAIWESGIVHPEDVLADLIHIFHPELLPQHQLIYYEQLQ